MAKYTQGVCDDDAAILEDGVVLTVEEVVDQLNELERYREMFRPRDARVEVPNCEDRVLVYDQLDDEWVNDLMDPDGEVWVLSMLDIQANPLWLPQPPAPEGKT